MKSNSLTLPFAVIGFVALVGAASAFANQATAIPGDPPRYAEYRNDTYHYALLVPDDMVVGEYEARGIQTVTFVDAGGDKQLQISAMPYTELDVTLGRLQEARATSDQADHLEIVSVFRDDLFSVAFRKNGISYLVVTMPELEPWLTDILRTWQFI